MLFGKTSPAEMRKRTGLSKATMFRNLALLSEAGLVDKEEDTTVSDKRYSLQYYVRQDLMALSKRMYSEELREYAKAVDRVQVLNEWFATLKTLPLTLNRLTTQLMLSMRHPSPDGVPDRCQKVIMALAYCLEDVDDLQGLIGKLGEFTKALDPYRSKIGRDWKKPLRKPVAIVMSVTALDPTETCDEPGARLKDLEDL